MHKTKILHEKTPLPAFPGLQPQNSGRREMKTNPQSTVQIISIQSHPNNLQPALLPFIGLEKSIASQTK